MFYRNGFELEACLGGAIKTVNVTNCGKSPKGSEQKSK